MAKSMLDQNGVLAILVKVDGSLPLVRLCLRLGFAEENAAKRKRVICLLGKLMQKKLVARTNKADLGNQREPEYAATDKGRKFVKDGGTITSGCQDGKWNSKPRVTADSARQRIWTVFRRQKKATFATLVEIVRNPGEDADAMIDNARKFFAAIARAGIVTRMKDREGGFAPTSNGFLRYALVKDLGPLVPVPGTRGVYDPNAREMIAYLPAKKAVKS